MSSAEPRPPSRIGHQEREDAVRALGEHFAQGRITGDEYEERVGLAWQSRIAPDLQALFTDLPDPRPGGAGPDPSTSLYPAPGWSSGSTPAPYPQPGYPQPWSAGHPATAGGYDAAAPYGRDPYSGRPYSDKSKIVAGVLQLFLPFGVGRFYSGHTGLAVAQLLVTLFTLGIGAIWPFIDGIVILAGRPDDPDGRPLRP